MLFQSKQFIKINNLDSEYSSSSLNQIKSFEMDEIDPEVGLKFSKKSKRKKRICDSFRWFYFFLFVEHVLAIFFATMALYLAFTCRRS